MSGLKSMPEWLAQIEDRIDVTEGGTVRGHMRRLLELCKAQHEALESLVGKTSVEMEVFAAYDRARRLWEGE